MFRVLCILALAIVLTLGQDEEIKDPEIKETKPNVAFNTVFEPCAAPFVTQNYNDSWVSRRIFLIHILLSKKNLLL